MTVFVIDHGCYASTSHHFGINIALFNECKKRKIPIRFFYNAKCDAKIKSILHGEAVFQSPIIYDRPENEIFPFDEMSQVNHMFENELDKYITDHILPGDTIIIHTLTCAHLIGLFLWYRRIKDHNINIRIVFRFPANFRTHTHLANLYTQFYHYTIHLWSTLQSPNITFFADSEALAAEYNKINAVPFHYAPLPIDFSHYVDIGDSNVQGNYPQSGLHFMFLGETRKEKGVHFLLPAIIQYLKKYSNATFTIQVDSLPSTNIPIELKANLKFLTGSLVGSEYYSLLSSGDVILVPYDPHEYTLRTSHIFVEAIGFGKPVITTLGSWMDSELQKFNGTSAAAIMKAFDLSSLSEAMIEITQAYDNHKNEALRLAPLFRKKHNIGAFAQTLL